MKHLKQLFMLFILLWSLVMPSTVLAATSSSSSSSTSSTSASSSSAVSSSSSSSSSTDDSLQKIKQKGTLVVGTSADYPPYEFTTKINGKTKYVGFEIQLDKRLAKDLGVKLVIKNMDFDSLMVALETGKIDAVVGALNVTNERKKSVDFSHTYYSGNSYFLINKNDRSRYKTAKDFKGKTVGAQNGTTQSSMIKKSMPYATNKGLAKLSNLVIALQSHKVDAVLMDEATAKAYAANNDNFVAFNSKLPSTAGDMAIAFPKGSTALVAAANKTIDEVNKENVINKKWLPEASKYMRSYKKQNTVLSYWRYFAKGVEYTLIITVVSVFFGFILGTLFALMRLSKNKLLHAISVCYIEFLRGTPMMVQIMFVYFGIGAVIRSMPALLAGIIAVSLNSGAYVAEIIRSGIQSIPLGQTEAARSLGMSKSTSFHYVIMPQALKNIWPALGNELITLLKDSSLVSTIGVGELMFETQLVQADTYKGVLPLFITMMIYFVMTFTLSRVLLYFEGRMKHAH
ncbi:ABC transporter substrate-binding protein/permease [Limosilactobacillus sp.]|jgi:polar amino acid transport system substrate-binding protein|uniref:ABC transporter substrate-binding protein/permease n=1 Tax=Limosilactobacillus sp. TaxID=2773925 RepID=UPI0025C23A33|nr:ABC transporter substrate-binding protein/permease [Limosilactobacillus sp.]MCH3922651.1 ABC transporter substrate-binding protein/permease [Limosilactobacillus sp.]MCH3927334.1 ABC transporter substrate-binding protein/permease [Limosilactobacillus sp.]